MKRWIGAPLYHGLQVLRREPVASALNDVRRTEFISVEEMRSLQAERQLAQLRFAVQHVPWYQQTCAKWIRDINEARAWNDAKALMCELPIIDRDDVTSNPDAFRPAGIRRPRTYPDKTSGSSGTPFMFPCDQRAWAYRHAVMLRCMESFGVRAGEPYALFFGLHWNPKIRLTARIRDLALNRVRVSAYDIEPGNLDRHLQAIEKHAPVFFFGYPSAIYDFCVLLKDRGLDLKHLGLKAVFLTAEPLLTHHRSLIGDVTGSRCVNLYGSAEGGTTAFECPNGSLHIATEAVWLQLREPNGIQSEAVVTDMMLRAFPLLKYAIGDEVVMREGVCECGRPHPMLHSVRGRCGDPIVLPNGRRINPNLPSYIFKPPYVLHAIRRYRFVQAEGSPLELQIVVSKSFREEHLAILREETLAAFGKDVPLSIRIVASLPHLPNAKHRDFVYAPSE